MKTTVLTTQLYLHRSLPIKLRKSAKKIKAQLNRTERRSVRSTLKTLENGDFSHEK